MVFLDTTPVYHLHVLHPLHVSAYSILHFTPGLNQGNEWDVSGRHCTEWRTEPGGHSCPLIIMLGLKLRKVCPGIHGSLRKGGFNPTNRPKKTPNPWSTCQHTFKTWPCVLLQASDLQATSVYMSNRNNPDGDLTLLYFLMNQIFKWVDWKDRWENLSQSKALTRVTTLSGAAWWSLLIKNCLCFSW